jgi:uncharacterized membrane protein
MERIEHTSQGNRARLRHPLPMPDPEQRRLAVSRQPDVLGWLSIGLGVAQLVAPRKVARLVGVDEESEASRLALRAIGLRELACGMGLLSHSRATLWAGARVAGDVVDLALLGSALDARRSNRGRLFAAAAGVAAIAVVDAAMARAARRELRDLAAEGIAVQQSVTISCSPHEVYAFFRRLENLPTFMSHLESIRSEGKHSHWRARGPWGTSVEWDAEVIEEVPDERIAWRSLAGARVPNQGRVQFRPAPGGGATEVQVELRYDPPAGRLGAAFAKLFGSEPAQQISSDLRRLKQVLETGEVLHSDASIHRGLHPARPVERPRELLEQKVVLR